MACLDGDSGLNYVREAGKVQAIVTDRPHNFYFNATSGLRREDDDDTNYWFTALVTTEGDVTDVGGCWKTAQEAIRRWWCRADPLEAAVQDGS